MQASWCLVCGKKYEKQYGWQKYCSKECAYEAIKQRQRLRKPKPWKPPRDIVCIKCGGIFKGKGRQAICQTCLHKRPDCKRYLEARSERFEVRE